MAASGPLTLNPQIIGQAENAHLAILTRALAGTGVTREQWVALTLANREGGTISRHQLASLVSGALKLGDDVAQTAIAHLISLALLAETGGKDASVSVSDAGKTLFERVRSANSEVVARAYADIPADDLATAARVLTIITARLTQEVAGA